MPTRIISNKNGTKYSSQIDYFATNLPLDQFSERVEQFNISDHLSISFILKINGPHEVRLAQNKVPKTDIREENLWQLRNFMMNENFTDMLECNSNINDMYSLFFNTILYALELTCPIIQLKTNSNIKSNWATKSIIDEGRKLADLFWLMSNSNNEQLNNDYKELKKEHRRNINQVKFKYTQDKINSSIDPRETQKIVWQTVKAKTRKTKSELPVQMNINGKTTTDPLIISNAFAKHNSVNVPSIIE
ncbi:hypothetical protein JTB14_012486 [Gonioctena quinquepunctata]|nr:hypothetical protein JTB14_012486 [Gonioctena quinquepunctata]